MTSGTIKFFNIAKKFGFITPDGGGKDIFLPPTSISEADLGKLQAGALVAFETVADKKGDKAVNVKVISRSVSPPGNATVYFDPSKLETAVVIDAVTSRTNAPALADYVAKPLTIDQLKRLALLLSAGGQSLVLRYHPMFLELRLDDRFIAETDYWTAVAEHPALINGPIVVAGERARICRTAQDVESFYEDSKTEPLKKAKAISARLAAMMTGQDVSPTAEKLTPIAKAPRNLTSSIGQGVAVNSISSKKKAGTKASSAKADRPASTSSSVGKPSPESKKAAPKKPTSKTARRSAKPAKSKLRASKKKTKKKGRH